jgi:hypothetical protein
MSFQGFDPNSTGNRCHEAPKERSEDHAPRPGDHRIDTDELEHEAKTSQGARNAPCNRDQSAEHEENPEPNAPNSVTTRSNDPSPVSHQEGNDQTNAHKAPYYVHNHAFFSICRRKPARSGDPCTPQGSAGRIEPVPRTIPSRFQG